MSRSLRRLEKGQDEVGVFSQKSSLILIWR